MNPSISASGHKGQGGLTLLELLVVVAILAVLATVAIQSTTDIGNQTRYDATQKSIGAFRTAVLGPPGQTAPDGSRMATGFIADMGRVPRSRTLIHPEFGGVPDLTELYSESLPSGLKAYALHTAGEAYVALTSITAVSLKTIPERTALYDATVKIPAGWRGPYLRKPPTELTLVDGWQKPLVSRVDMGSTLAELQAWPTMLLRFRTGEQFGLQEDANYTAITDANLDVVGVFSVSGFDGAPASTDAYSGRFYSTIQKNEYQVKLVVSVAIPTDGFYPTWKSANSYIQVSLYGPNPEVASASNGKPVRVWVHQIPYTADTPANVSVDFDGVNAPTIGTRVLRVVLKGPATNDLVKGRVVYAPISSGSQTINIPFP